MDEKTVMSPWLLIFLLLLQQHGRVSHGGKKEQL
jgi:hypothetical protein